jgi:hypothetical protein
MVATSQQRFEAERLVDNLSRLFRERVDRVGLAAGRLVREGRVP